jgi:hypothetical protein
VGPEIRRTSGRFGAADTLCSATHFEGAETYADMSRIPGLKTHHGSLHFRTNFGPLNSASFQSDFASILIMDTVKLQPLTSTLQGHPAWARFSTSSLTILVLSPLTFHPLAFISREHVIVIVIVIYCTQHGPVSEHCVPRVIPACTSPSRLRPGPQQSYLTSYSNIT